ncbi:hypothetical protein AB1Y20_017257 [Prymnesium parvum]|uniref:Uncharacterized protein n=1 Tax=Prymnesium parvum TaxID=97485 RepID=A0AB34JNG5_PRYPA
MFRRWNLEIDVFRRLAASGVSTKLKLCERSGRALLAERRPWQCKTKGKAGSGAHSMKEKATTDAGCSDAQESFREGSTSERSSSNRTSSRRASRSLSIPKSMGSFLRRRGSRSGSEAIGYTAAEHAKATNKNLVSAFAWTAELLESITTNRQKQVTDLATGRTGVPVFAVYGACPNSFCGMQAVLYVKMDGDKGPPIDFWWIKPQANNRAALETATLDRHAKGPHKNDPGRSRPLYAQFSTLFDSKPTQNSQPLVAFGMTTVGDAPRAYIDQVETGERYYIYLIWQEAWSSIMSRQKFIKGKIVYQKDPTSNEYFARPYTYRESCLEIPAAATAEESVAKPLPTDTLKRMPDAD